VNAAWTKRCYKIGVWLLPLVSIIAIIFEVTCGPSERHYGHLEMALFIYVHLAIIIAPALAGAFHLAMWWLNWNAHAMYLVFIFLASLAWWAGYHAVWLSTQMP